MLRGLLVIFAVLCACAMSQFPEFHQQYMQRVGGAYDELSRQVAGLDERAAAAEMNRYPYIRRLIDNNDEVVRREGEALLAMVGRHKRLENLLKDMETTPGYLLAVKTVGYLEADIAQEALKAYKPALPLTVSGAGHAFGGFLFGYLLPLLLRLLVPRREPVRA